MITVPTPPHNTRLGFHYYPDALHYRESDLAAWLPELRALGASWLTLTAPARVAVPETFLAGLLEAGIEPVLHFSFRVEQAPALAELRLLFETYAHWGVHYVVLFDQPNTRPAWGTAAWAQSSLVERFLDAYLPLAEASVEAGLIPVFPPLKPGGDYWDTAFLRAALQGILRRGHSSLLQKMVLGLYAWYGNRSLDWGAGGPESWPAARPYSTPPGTQDQCGFRIYDWYQTIFQAIAGFPCKTILLKVGYGPSGLPFDSTELAGGSSTQRDRQAEFSLEIARRIINFPGGPASETTSETPSAEPVPEEVLAANFWLLAASQDHPAASQAWYQTEDKPLPVVGLLRQKLSIRTPHQTSKRTSPAPDYPTPSLSVGQAADPNSSARPISHYLLLPVYDWGIADWHLEVVRPFVKKHRPTVGFSITEAMHAARVTVVGGEASFPPHTVEELRAVGCLVQQIQGDGTSIATQLASVEIL